MDLNDLLTARNFAPETVLVMRHRPYEPELNRVLPWLAAERPELFNAYQQSQSETVERAMTRDVRFVASFIGRDAGRATYVGLYSIGTARPITRQEYWNIPANAELAKYGMRGFPEESTRQTVLWFELTPVEFYGNWKGKLVVSWPPPERSWWRRAHRNEFAILAIHEESVFDAEMPSWQNIVLTWDELRVLPARWRTRLSEWRAIYYIFDRSDGKGYVGSAYGSENLLGRWLNYGIVGHGGNKLLRQRDPKNFRFSILQRVSPDLETSDVVRLEGTWKERLHTKYPLGLNDN